MFRNVRHPGGLRKGQEEREVTEYPEHQGTGLDQHPDP